MKQKRRLVTALITSTSLVLSSCGTLTGIPAHGGGKRFSVEQRLVSASIRATLKSMDVTALKGQKVAIVYDLISDEGGGQMGGGRLSLGGVVKLGTAVSPVTSTSSQFQVFDLVGSSTNYNNVATSSSGNSAAITSIVSNGTGTNIATTNGSSTNNGVINSTGTSNGTGTNTATTNTTSTNNGSSTSTNTINGSSTGASDSSSSNTTNIGGSTNSTTSNGSNETNIGGSTNTNSGTGASTSTIGGSTNNTTGTTGVTTTTGATTTNQNGTSTNTTNVGGSNNSGTNSSSSTTQIGGSTNTGTNSADSTTQIGGSTNTNNGTNSATSSGTNTSTNNGTGTSTNTGSSTQTTNGQNTSQTTSTGTSISNNEGTNTSTTNGSSTSSNNSNENSNTDTTNNSESDSTGGTNSTSQVVAGPVNQTVQRKGTMKEAQVQLQYSGLGNYSVLGIPKSDASLLMGLVRNYFLLNDISVTVPQDPSATALVYVTVDVFGINRSRFDAYVFNRETVKAETGIEMFAFSREGKLIMKPESANYEAEYDEKYLFWAGPFRSDQTVREGEGLLVDYSDVDGTKNTYPSAVRRREDLPNVFD